MNITFLSGTFLILRFSCACLAAMHSSLSAAHCPTRVECAQSAPPGWRASGISVRGLCGRPRACRAEEGVEKPVPECFSRGREKRPGLVNHRLDSASSAVSPRITVLDRLRTLERKPAVVISIPGPASKPAAYSIRMRENLSPPPPTYKGGRTGQRASDPLRKSRVGRGFCGGDAKGSFTPWPGIRPLRRAARLPNPRPRT